MLITKMLITKMPLTRMKNKTMKNLIVAITTSAVLLMSGAAQAAEKLQVQVKM